MRRPGSVAWRLPVIAAAPALVAAGLVLSGCGGGARQDADEPTGSYHVEVVDAHFPENQGLAETSRLQVRVRNTGEEAIPNVAMTVDGFNDEQAQPGAADPSRPLWIVNRGPADGVTAYHDTWALGRLPAGDVRTFTWNVTAVVPGTHTLRYRVAAGLNGKARAVNADDEVPEGTLTVRVTRRPQKTTVDPDTGRVIVTGPAR